MTRCLPLILLAACAQPDAPPARERVPAALAEADEAWIQGDFRRVTAALLEVLANRPDPVVRDSALELAEAAFGAAGARLPADWSLPERIRRLRFSVIRKSEPDRSSFHVLLDGHVDDPAAIRQVRLTGPAGEVLLDRRAGRGGWSSERDPDGHHYFELEGPEGARAPQPGLYRLDLELDDGHHGGWFIATNLVASATPHVIAPAPGETQHGPHPRLAFEDFHSPEFGEPERRSVGVYVIRLLAQQPARWAHAWSWSSQRPEATDARLGDTLGRRASLEPGDYWASVTFSEARRFGPITLRRAARTAVPFRVTE